MKESDSRAKMSNLELKWYQIQCPNFEEIEVSFLQFSLHTFEFQPCWKFKHLQTQVGRKKEEDQFYKFQKSILKVRIFLLSF